jgi:type 1 fimbria pilin
MNRISNLNSCAGLSLLLIGMLTCGSLMAADNLLFRGTLVEPPSCTINNDQRINVDFGDRLGISKIDGSQYRQTINYQVQCEDSAIPADLMLTVVGTTMSGDPTAIQSDKTGLGIRILRNGVPMMLGQRFSVDKEALPRLEAVPIAAADEDLTEGAFIATASLLAEYQ